MSKELRLVITYHYPLEEKPVAAKMMEGVIFHSLINNMPELSRIIREKKESVSVKYNSVIKTLIKVDPEVTARVSYPESSYRRTEYLLGNVKDSRALATSIIATIKKNIPEQVKQYSYYITVTDRPSDDIVNKQTLYNRMHRFMLKKPILIEKLREALPYMLESSNKDYYIRAVYAYDNELGEEMRLLSRKGLS